tara:strand:+ start:76 stop:900 length:825 start_codon:yes stop_codon:yes gene_type:complete
MNLKFPNAKKRFGQHWLINKQILDRITKAAELNANDIILEIGPGQGALTSKLLDTSINSLHAVELDKDLISFLNKKYSNINKFSLTHGDILSINIDEIGFKFTKVIANIPYNITGPILDIFVGRLGQRQKNIYKKIIFMMQKDVVDRIIAKAGDKNNGALSTRIKLIADVKKICDIPPSSFQPPPKVNSSLIVFQPFSSESRLNLKLEKGIEKILKITFNSRRKKIRNTLKSILSDADINLFENNTNINFDLRPQDLTISEWIKIGKNYIKIEK